MKPVKTVLVVVAVSAIGLLATGGSAAAETLCTVNPPSNECPLANRLPIGEVFVAQTGEIVIKTTAFTIKCVSQIKGSTVENLGPATGLKAKLTELTATACNGCTGATTTESLVYKVVMTSTSGTLGTVTFNQWEMNGVPKIKFTACPGGLTCIYGAAATSFNWIGSAGIAKPAFIEIGAAQTLQKQAGSSVECPGTASWEKGKYEVSAPLPVWLAAKP
jgi:hypothetical protein